MPFALFCDTLAFMPALPRNLSSTLDKIARAAVGRDWPLYASLLDHWREIVGEEYAKNTSPVKIVFPKGKKTGEKWAGGQRTGGILHIRLPQGLAMAFSFQSELVRRRINGFFGYEAIAKIAFNTFYPENQPEEPAFAPSLSAEDKSRIQENIKNIDNNELRDLLQQLGESVLSKKSPSRS